MNPDQGVASAAGQSRAAGGSREAAPAGRPARVLVCNAGSSSLRVALFAAEREELLADAHVDWSGQPVRLGLRRAKAPEIRETAPLSGHEEALARVLALLGEAGVDAVGHRVVHGGDRFSGPVVVTPEVVRTIGEFSRLAPLHNPASLACIRAAERMLPGVPQVAAFDTAFHANLPEAARTYAIPGSWTRRWGLRRYGFHGLSHEYCARRAAELLGRPVPRLLIAHLGHGASLAAVRDGACIDTSMGFTPLEGLVMGTRSGSVDPGLLLHLLRDRGLDPESLDRALNQESGLLGVSGLSADMRTLLAAQATNADARLAIEIYVHRLRQTIGALAASLGGLDALVFTAGVGENSPEIRRRACAGLEHLGLRLDEAANDSRASDVDADVARRDSAARILVIASREDLTIVRAARRLIFT